MNNTQHFRMCIFNLVALINNLANVEKKPQGDTNYFQFNAIVHELNERLSGEHRLSTEIQGMCSFSSL